jgi:ATP-binding cassette subfamily D (ALD) protein 3
MMRKPISRYTVIEQQLEGHFRFVNSRLITNSEEIAFYNGNKKEGSVLSGVSYFCEYLSLLHVCLFLLFAYFACYLFIYELSVYLFMR